MVLVNSKVGDVEVLFRSVVLPSVVLEESRDGEGEGDVVLPPAGAKETCMHAGQRAGRGRGVSLRLQYDAQQMQADISCVHPMAKPLWSTTTELRSCKFCRISLAE